MAITSGQYAILSALDQSVRLDVTGESTSRGANVELWSENAGTGNNQLFYIPPESGGYIYLQNPRTTYVVDAEWTGAAPQSGNNLVMWSYHGGNNQLFKAVQDGTATYNGVSVPAYRFQSKANSTLYIDACGGGSRPGTNVWLWEYLAWQVGQIWVPVKTSAYASGLPVPSDVSLLMPDGTESRSVAGARGPVTMYPRFTSAGSSHQMRYRYRTRSSSDPDSYRTAWSTWRSIADGTQTDGGWGDAWSANCTTTETGGRHTCAAGISVNVDGTTLDLVDVQLEVRSFAASWGSLGVPAHGSSAVRTVTVARMPQVTVAGAAFAPDGLRVSYTSDFPRGNNRVSTLVDAADGRLAPTMVEVYQDATGYVLTDSSLLARVPAESESVDVSLGLTTTDGVTVSVADSKQVAYTDGTMAFSPTVSFDAASRLASVASGVVGAQLKIWVETADGMLPMDDQAHVPYPLGVPWAVWALAYTDELHWAVARLPQTEQRPDGFRWNWADMAGRQHYCRVRCGDGEVPKASVDTTIDAEFARTYGREWEVAHIGRSKARSISVDGVVLDSDSGDAGRFAELIDARFAWFRDGAGHVWRVGVSETSEKRTPFGWSTVSVECKVVDHGRLG